MIYQEGQVSVMRKVRTRAASLTLSLLFILSAFAQTAFASDRGYVSITVTPEQEYYDVFGDEDAEKNVTFVMAAHDMDEAEEYELEFEIINSVTLESLVSNTYGNTYKSVRMDQFNVDWENNTNYTLFANLLMKDEDDVSTMIHSTSFSFIVGEDLGTTNEGNREPVTDYRDNLTGQSEWEYGLTIENNHLNVTIHQRQWLDPGFWDELDANGDGVTLDSEVHAYVTEQNDLVGVEDIKSPILSIGDGPLGWESIHFELSHTITADGRDLYVDWMVTANSTTFSGTSLSFLVELSENDTRLVDQYGAVFVHLTSEDWHISSVSAFGALNEDMSFSKKESEGDDYWSASKDHGDELPNLKVILSTTVLGDGSGYNEVPEPPVDHPPDCQLTWNHIGDEVANLITEELTGNYDLELEPGSYELVFQCIDQDGDVVDVILSSQDMVLTATGNQLTRDYTFIVSDNMSSPLQFTISWTSNGTTGQLSLEIQESNRPILVLPDGQEIPGFTTVLATLGLLGAAFVRRD